MALCTGEILHFPPRSHSVHYTGSVPQYKVQEKHFQSLIPAQTDPSVTTHLRILANRPDRPARIELSGLDKKTIGGLKVRIEQLTAGEKLLQWDRVFYGPGGGEYLEKVNNESRAYIRADRRQSAGLPRYYTGSRSSLSFITGRAAMSSDRFCSAFSVHLSVVSIFRLLPLPAVADSIKELNDESEGEEDPWT